MYEVHQTRYGIRTSFDGFVRRDEMASWAQDFKTAISQYDGRFGVLVDNRTASVFPADAQEVLFDTIEYARNAGMERGTVVLSSTLSKIQADRVAKETGIDTIMRHVDASTDPDWESKALAWITQGVEPH